MVAEPLPAEGRVRRLGHAEVDATGRRASATSRSTARSRAGAGRPSHRRGCPSARRLHTSRRARARARRHGRLRGRRRHRLADQAGWLAAQSRRGRRGDRRRQRRRPRSGAVPAAAARAAPAHRRPRAGCAPRQAAPPPRTRRSRPVVAAAKIATWYRAGAAAHEDEDVRRSSMSRCATVDRPRPARPRKGPPGPARVPRRVVGRLPRLRFFTAGADLIAPPRRSPRSATAKAASSWSPAT